MEFPGYLFACFLVHQIRKNSNWNSSDSRDCDLDRKLLVQKKQALRRAFRGITVEVGGCINQKAGAAL